MSQEVAKVFRLDDIELLFQEAQKRHARMAEDKKWLDEFKELAKKMSGGADDWQLRGETVAKLTPGALNTTKLAKEHPDLIEKYTRFVTEKRFDRGWFQQEEPELYEMYRARALTFK